MNLHELRDLVWGEDIASPTCPEYREHHESIQKILKAIDSMMAQSGKTYTDFERAGYNKEQSDALELLCSNTGVHSSVIINALRGFVNGKV